MLRSTATLMICIMLIASMGWLSYGQTTGQIDSPRQTTIFLTDPTETEQIQESLTTIYYDTGDTQSFPLDQATQKVKNLTQWLDDLEKQIHALDAKYGISNEKYSKTRKEVIDIMASINTTTNKLAGSLKKILYFQSSLLSDADAIKDIRKDFDQTNDYMQRFTEFIYKTSNEYYSNDGQHIDDIKLFLKSDDNANISEQLANTAMVESVMNNMNTLADKLKEEEKKVITRIKQSNTTRVTLRRLIDDYNDRLSNLEEQKDFLTNYLKFFANEGNTQAISLEFPWLFDTKPELLASIKSIAEQIAQASYDNTSFDVAKKLEELANTEAFATRDEKAAPLSRPAYPIVSINKYFNDPNNEKDFKTSYPGIEIAVPQWTPLYAMNEWLVYEIKNKDGIGISWIAIIDKSWAIIFYLYPNTIAIKEWDIVRRGQFIGYSGGEPGTKGAWFASWGPNLTLLILKDATFVDPLAYLDLSVIQDRSNLPSSYQFEYLQSKYNLPRDGYTVKPFAGNSIAERRQNFLNTYAKVPYNQEALWVKASEWTNIDTDLGICIAFAESTLGNHLSTSNNIGNVGNNDRGDRVSYAAPFIGARLIYTTLNNAYLGQYNIILDYNGYGNPDGKNYATSKYNWQNNVRNCLTQIKWYHVPDDYPVRVGPRPSANEQLVTANDPITQK